MSESSDLGLRHVPAVLLTNQLYLNFRDIIVGIDDMSIMKEIIAIPHRRHHCSTLY
jgi:hypothetical protein